MDAEKKHHGTGNFVPNSVRIIDYNSSNKNLLVRGSSAFGAGNFVLSDLIKAIKSAPNYSDIGFTVSDSPMIIDFCLIGFGPDNHKDKRIVHAEQAWFADTTPPALNGGAGPYPTITPGSTKGQYMIYWPIMAIGGTVPTAAGGNWNSAGAVDISILADNNGFNFSGLVPAISSALNNDAAGIPGLASSTQIQNAIIYVHCDSGINRTGAAIISYLMQYGSNIGALGIAANPASPYHQLSTAQNAAQVDPPEGNVPVGGADQGVSEAYCNLINAGSPTANLSERCVPLSGSVNT